MRNPSSVPENDIDLPRLTSGRHFPNARIRWIIPALIGFLFLASIVFFWSSILLALGNALIRSGLPRNADVILVIGGDYTGERILKGAELAREGYAPAVFMSGGGSMYGFHETDLELAFVRDHGYTAQRFIQFRYSAESTADEAKHVIPEFRKMGIHSYLLVTNPAHTARAGAVFRRTAPEMEIQVVSAPDRDWIGGRWWTTREGRKEWLLESVKTIADWFRL